MNSWVRILGDFKNPPGKRRTDAARARRWRKRNKGKYRAYCRERNRLRLEYFRARDKNRKDYFARWQRERRAELKLLGNESSGN